jgi:small multidrug resistance family-3 protein
LKARSRKRSSPQNRRGFRSELPGSEVGGDAVIRKGLRGEGGALIVLGCLLLAGYGLIVNLVKWDFSKLLGVYVAVFAVVSVDVGQFPFGESVPMTTWAGMGIIVGGRFIQFGEN